MSNTALYVGGAVVALGMLWIVARPQQMFAPQWQPGMGGFGNQNLTTGQEVAGGVGAFLGQALGAFTTQRSRDAADTRRFAAQGRGQNTLEQNRAFDQWVAGRQLT
jgi:hypothetical protein